MKHLFNFVPTVKYRKGSSFLVRTIIVLLYFIPGLLLLFHSFEILIMQNTEERLSIFSKRLERHYGDTVDAISKLRPDQKNFNALLDKSVAYHNLLKNTRFSWSDLLKGIEEVIPGGVKISRVGMKPATMIEISLEGKAENVHEITAFLQNLFNHPQFFRPVLLNYRTSNFAKDSLVDFRMHVEYFPKKKQWL